MAMRVVALALAGLVFWAGCSPVSPPPAARQPSRLVREARDRLEGMRAQRQRVLLWYGLGSKAAPVFVDLARDFYVRALALAPRLVGSRVPALAADLRRQAGGLPGAGELARDLERTAYAAWPWILLAHGARPLDRALAGRALDLARNLIRVNPNSADQDRDRSLLVQVRARWDPVGARGLIPEIRDPAVAARTWRALALVTNSPRDLARAAAAAAGMADLSQRALSLAYTARAYYHLGHAGGGQLLQRALALAGRVSPARRRAWLGGALAAVQASLDPAAAWRSCRRVAGGYGARFVALVAVGDHYLGREPARGKQALEDALADLGSGVGRYQVFRARALVSRHLASSFPGRARRLWREIPPWQNLLRAGPLAAMVLAGAPGDMKGALVRAGAVAEPRLRLEVLARLAGLEMSSAPERGRALYRRVLAESGRLGIRLSSWILAGAWRVLGRVESLKLAMGLRPAGYRARALFSLALARVRRGDAPGAQECIFWALEALNGPELQQTLDKARILGDMGRKWSIFEPAQARRFFILAAEACEDSG